MQVFNKQFFFAFATLVGYVIGVGIFGLPYVTSQIGLVGMLIYFLLLGFLVITIHLLLGEIVLRTESKHRLPGYVKLYLGPVAKKIILFSTFFGFYGILLVYLIVGGDFLWGLLNPWLGGSKLFYALIFWSFSFFIIWRGSKIVAETELFFFVMFIVIIFSLGWISYNYFSWDNIPLVNWQKPFSPYGILLFSLWGSGIIPELRDLLKGREKSLKTVIISGIIFTALIYLFFIIMILGITDGQVTKEALLGLKQVLPNFFINLALIFGIFAILSSFIGQGLILREIWQFDYQKSKSLSLVLTGLIPLVLLFFKTDGFLEIIGFVGAVTLGIDGILILLIHQKAKSISAIKNPQFEIKLSQPFAYCLAGLFLLGVVIEIVNKLQ